MGKNKKMFKKSKRADDFNSSQTIKFEDDMFSQLSGANKLLIMIAEEIKVTPLIGEYNETLYVSRETVSEIGEALGLL